MRIARRLLAAAMCALAALAMCVGLAGTAWGEDGNGSITISNAAKGQTYSVYRIFDLESYSGDNYSYKVVDAWKSFFESGNPGADYITVDEDGYVAGTKEGFASDSDSAAAFAKAALVWAKGDTGRKAIDATVIEKADSSTVTFKLDSLGYYLVSSGAGALCILDTNTTNLTIVEKNGAPTVKKTVRNVTANENDFVGSTTASYGDTLQYCIRVTMPKGTQRLVLTDTMNEKLNLDATSFKVGTGATDEGASVLAPTDAGSNIDTDGGTVNVTYGTAENASFKLTFSCTSGMSEEDILYVYYSATLAGDAKTATEIENTVAGVYGEGDTAIDGSKATVKTFSFGVVKTAKADGKVIAGAKFKLYDAETGGNEIKVVADGTDGDDNKTTYKFANNDNVVKGADIVAGLATVKGLRNGTYWLEETAAPAGYNKLASRVEVKIEDGNLTYADDAAIGGVCDKDKTTAIVVENSTGTELPSTGGMGTTVIYVAGGLLVAAAVVLLVAKKKMSANDK